MRTLTRMAAAGVLAGGVIATPIAASASESAPPPPICPYELIEAGPLYADAYATTPLPGELPAGQWVRASQTATNGRYQLDDPYVSYAWFPASRARLLGDCS